jgi:hypothetical protein
MGLTNVKLWLLLSTGDGSERSQTTLVGMHVSALVGCANSDRTCELAVRIRRGAVVWRPTDRLGGPLRAVEVRLPHLVPLHPAIGAAGPRRCRQGPGDPGAPSPAGRAAPPNQTTQARSCRPGGACRHQPRLAPSPLVVLLRQARDAAALAPAAGRRRLDLPAPRNRSTSARPGAAAAHRPPGPGEPTLGYRRIQGELLRLGMHVSATAIRTTLRRHRLDPTPRPTTTTWRAFVRQQAAGIVACDSSPSTPSGCGGSTSCSSSNSALAGSTWPG